jgi:hypothetical protein
MTDTALLDRIAAADRPTTTGDMIAVGPGEHGWHPTVLPWDTAMMFRSRWDEAQTDFIDDPRSAVERADALVADVMRRLADALATQRTGIETEWKDNGEVSTEDLRMAFQRYRAFLARLLSL